MTDTPGLEHVNPHRFDDVSGSRRIALRAACDDFLTVLREQVGVVDPPHGQGVVDRMGASLDDMMLTLFPPPAPEAKPVPVTDAAVPPVKTTKREKAKAAAKVKATKKATAKLKADDVKARAQAKTKDKAAKVKAAKVKAKFKIKGGSKKK